MVSLASFVGSFPCVAFSGSRLSGSSAAASCRAFLPVVSGFSGSVGVGCASGVDSVVRSAFPSASVFRVSSFLVGGRVSRASFALRSSALVVCLWRFRLVLVLLVLLFLRLLGAVVRVLGVLLPLLLVWAARCLWCRLWVLVLLGLVLWVLVSASLVLLPVAVRFGSPLPHLCSLLCFSS